MKTVIVSLLLSASVWAADAPKTKEVAPKAEAFQIHKYETQTLDNGLTILWVADQALPYVSLQMMFRSGSAQDPKGKEGLAAFTANLLEKGTTKRSASQIAEDLEQIGSGFESGTDPDYTMLSASALSFHKESALKQFAEIVLQPSFTNAEIERFRKQVLGSLQKMADHAEQFTEYLLPNFLYGDHPYGHQSIGTAKAVKHLKRVDLQKYYADNYTPQNAVLAVTGQFDEAWRADVVKAFEAWKAKTGKPVEVPDFPSWKESEILLVDRGDLNQAQIEIGFKGVPRNMPEYLEYRAAIKVLGEGFGSRLFEEIRVKRALTYHIHAWFEPRLKSGPAGIYTFTRVDKIAETVEETLKILKKFVSEGVTDGEVETVKALMRGQFPRTFETPEALARQLLLLNRFGISSDYLTHYMNNLQLVSKDSINAAVKKYFAPDNLRVVVYAPKAKAEAALRAVGPVQVKKYKDFL